MRGPLQVVWFKRDLRIADHRPLALAASAGPVLPLYIVEPGLWAQPDASGRQWAFAAECLGELAASLARLGQPLLVEVGEFIVRGADNRYHSVQEIDPAIASFDARSC